MKKLELLFCSILLIRSTLLFSSDEESASKRAVPQTYENSEGFLRLQTLEETQTAVVRSNMHIKSRIVADSETYTQRDYDERLRQIYEVVYSFPETNFSSDTKPLHETYYYYEGESPLVNKIVQIDYAKNNKTETEFSTNSEPIRQLLFEINETTQRKLSETSWVYDDLGRVSEQRILEPKNTTRLLYTYYDTNKRPDVEQFTDGQLVSKTLYDAEGVIRERYEYFSEGMSIQTLYVNGKRSTQTVFNGNKILREQNFE